MRASLLAAPALLLVLAGAAPVRAAVIPPATRPVLAWIEDDYARARAQARERKLPIFVESWAPW
jgi:endonuclease YncB( thermonuclease family)